MEPHPGNEVISTAARHDGAIETDAIIIGAGPVGLFQVFELGLLDIKAHVIDSLAYVGGQPMELYPDKPIYDIPAISVCTGRELIASLMKQIVPFGATFHLSQEVSTVARQEDGRFFVATSTGTKFLTRTIFIAAGVGAFQPKRLLVEGMDKFDNTQLFYQVRNPADFAGKHLMIVGGGDTALDWALNFAADGPNKAESVILVHRRDSFQAAPASIARMRALCDGHKMQLLIGQIIGHEEQEGRMTGAKILGADGVTRVVPLDRLLVFFGLSPKLGPIANWSLDIERKQLKVDTEKFSTNIPGIFAVGDINTYPGKKKLILCGFHECTLAAFAAAPFIFPDRKMQLEYTTSSSRLHKLLGVASPVLD